MIRRNTYHIHSLGCAKNLVDSSVIHQMLNERGYRELSNPRRAGLIIINTCAFIHDARLESIEAIQNFIKSKSSGQKIIVAGCLSQRYQNKLFSDLPGIDAIIGTRDLYDIGRILDHFEDARKYHQLSSDFKNIPKLINPDEYHNTLIQGVSSYLKIADGCHRNCAFCAIPYIKGDLVSRKNDQVIRDALYLQSQGVKEINLIAQDTTAFGLDRPESNALATLLKELLPKIPDIKWVRLLYTYPGMVTEELIDLMAADNQLLPYLDMPLQHADPAVLRSMNRPANIARVHDLISRMKRRIPDLVTRTTFIVGYPTETDKSFQELKAFVEKIRFDHVGAFAYSPETGTPAEVLANPVPDEIKEQRLAELMALQEEISFKNSQAWIGKDYDMLIEGADESNRVIVGRIWRDAPEVDGLMIAEGMPTSDMMTKVKVSSATAHDLFGYQLKQ
ncbi:MAG TPA: 30S ribosomal protein S12 methylthiotransferase RimO [Anaerolineaceae bacterium]|nr:30S ribosomal protein S12 methylthiotransferase RimO [Anaerolineaceae bacterium]